MLTCDTTIKKHKMSTKRHQTARRTHKRATQRCNGPRGRMKPPQRNTEIETKYRFDVTEWESPIKLCGCIILPVCSADGPTLCAWLAALGRVVLRSLWSKHRKSLLFSAPISEENTQTLRLNKIGSSVIYIAIGKTPHIKILWHIRLIDLF